MEVIEGTEGLRGRFAHPVVALGNFDGVHRGHLALIRKVVARAQECGGVSMVVTFDPHPLKILSPEKSPPLLTTLETKLRVLKDLGVDVAICIPFTKAFSLLGPEAFIQEILIERLGAREVVVGHNYAFGQGRRGNVAQLEALGKTLQFRVWVVDPVTVDGEGVSSSKIRDLLRLGDVEQAAVYLGREYSVEGVVVRGHQRGAKLGYPTANVSDIPVMLPMEGVYAVRAELNAQLRDAIAYVGSQPTFQGNTIGLEVHLLDFTGEVYQESLRVAFVAWLRSERKFESQEALVSQIRQDVQKARQTLRPCAA